MRQFMDDDFLLMSDTARQLYHEHAKPQPIYDYHCHLNPQLIAEDHQFSNLGEIWLAGDHYKWRAMRSAGIDEQLITGNSSDKAKYDAWARTVPQCIGNPLYHWTHLELKRPFGIRDTLFGPQTADLIWQQCNEMLQTPEFSARGIISQMNVRMIGTTDDPIDSLQYHRMIADDNSIDVDVAPSWRPDRAFKIEQDGFSDYLRSLGEVCDLEITDFESLTRALSKRLAHFAQHGCRSADHGIDRLRFAQCEDEKVLNRIIQKRLGGETLCELEIAQYSTAVLIWLGREYHRLGWVMQLHLGALRNNNSRMHQKLGPDCGFDSINDRAIAEPLSALLNTIDYDDKLPKTILYCLNPRDNEVLATMIGNFQGGGIPGKIQFGSGWWFNDQKDGMERQMEQLAQLGLLSRFVGMLTDSRSFLSYTRHEYFRRILCNKLGNWVEQGEAPNDLTLLGKMVEDISYNNALNYFRLPGETR
ncbi:glucuronate isomerase [Dongshaea marina]|uniref:glucuronate isomerase n=1 Tax=Dongshaea marina TaxID=2047966 RepID=UPI000D3E6C3B|nr:glucuronate isomerase [Dongshaea marina]